MAADGVYVGWYGSERIQNWRTPPDLFDVFHSEYKFTMDGASEPGNGLLPKASTREMPLSWEGERVFCNPPWSDISPFIDMACEAEFAALLVPARTNAKWFHKALRVGASITFFPGRPNFLRPDGSRATSSPVDCLLLVFGRV
jgi:hypothetical protein